MVQHAHLSLLCLSGMGRTEAGEEKFYASQQLKKREKQMMTTTYVCCLFIFMHVCMYVCVYLFIYLSFIHSFMEAQKQNNLHHQFTTPKNKVLFVLNIHI